MNPKQKADLQQKLVLYNRQKADTAQALHRYEAIVEELQAQQEKYPDNKEVEEEPRRMIVARDARRNLHQKIVNLVSGIEWLLDE